MSAQLNHTIAWCTDKVKSAGFLAHVLGLPEPRRFMHFLAIFGLVDPTVVEIGTSLLRVLAFSAIFISVALTYTGGLQGTGDTKSPLYISIISQVAVPLGICFVLQQTGALEPLEVWIAILVGHMTRCLLSLIRFSQGKWRTINVDIERTEA